MSSGYGPNSRTGGLTLLECHQHHVDSCVHRYIYILLKFKIAFKSNANATSMDTIWISLVSSKWIWTHCMRFCYFTWVLVEMQSRPVIIPSDKFLCQLFCLFKVNLLCSLSIKLNRFLSIWRGLSPYLDSLYVQWKECYRLELETTSLASSRHWDLQLMLLTRIVLTTVPPSLLLTIAVPPINLMTSHQVIAHTATWSCKSLNILLSNQNQAKLPKSYLATELESGIFNDSEAENEEGTKYYFQHTLLFKPSHSFADSGVLNWR